MIEVVNPEPSYPIAAVRRLMQLRRWGMVEGPPDYFGNTRRVVRPDLF